jgi:Domain of unknown function (DUF4062)
VTLTSGRVVEKVTRHGEGHQMSRKPIAFISSTVKDLAEVRAHLKERLSDAGFEVRLSEDDGFPVEPGTTSHDACLEVVRTADLFVLLVGRRYGGEYPGQNKSITWREWDEALEVGLHPIVLVEGCVNVMVQACARRRAALQRENPALRLTGADTQLSDEFKARCATEPWGGGRSAGAPMGEDFGRVLPHLPRFVAELRKGHEDNWAHMNWDGSEGHAWEIVASRAGSTFAAYRQKWRDFRATQRRHTERLQALRRCALSVAEYARGEFNEGLAESLLKFLLSDRHALFDAAPGAKFSLTLHRKSDAEFVPYASARSDGMRPPTRRWKLGEGHVGLCAESGEELIAPDLEQSNGWVAQGEDVQHDRGNHRSAVAVPLGSPRAGR